MPVPGRRRRRSRLSLNRKIAVGFGGALAVLAIAAIVAWRMQSATTRDAAHVDTTHHVIETLRGLLGAVVDVESGQRGYLLSGDTIYLRPSHVGLGDLTARFAELSTLIIDGDQARRLEAIRPLIERRIALGNRAIALRDSAGMEAALGHEGRGLVMMDSIRAMIAEMEQVEVTRLAQQRSASARRQSIANRTIGVGLILAVLIAVAAVLLVRRDLAERSRVYQQILMLQALTREIASSASVEQALETSLKYARTLTGWKYAEAWLPAADGQTIRRIDAWSGEPETAPLAEAGRGLVYRKGEGVSGKAFAERRPILSEDLASAAEFPRGSIAASVGLHMAVAFPVMYGDAVIAVLTFVHTKPLGDDRRYVQLIGLATAQLGAVLERRKVEEALAEAKSAAERASRTKSDFLARMSHELRTPLNSVIGFAGVLQKNKRGVLVPRELEYLERIRANGSHLLRLINEILDLARIESGRMHLEMSDVPLHELLRDVIAVVSGQFEGRDVTLAVDAPDELAPLHTDRQKLSQVLINLVANAIKFTAHGSVTVRIVAETDTGVPQRIDVIDTGIGIPRDRQAAIFEAFEQAEPATTRAYGGSGLGLSISRSLCEMLGYRLTLDSEPGIGSVFSILLVPNVEPAALASVTTAGSGRRGG